MRNVTIHLEKNHRSTQSYAVSVTLRLQFLLADANIPTIPS